MYWILQYPPPWSELSKCVLYSLIRISLLPYVLYPSLSSPILSPLSFSFPPPPPPLSLSLHPFLPQSLTLSLRLSPSLPLPFFLSLFPPPSFPLRPSLLLSLPSLLSLPPPSPSRLLCSVVDNIEHLIDEWFPGLRDIDTSSGRELVCPMALCPLCPSEWCLIHVHTIPPL